MTLQNRGTGLNSNMKPNFSNAKSSTSKINGTTSENEIIGLAPDEGTYSVTGKDWRRWLRIQATNDLRDRKYYVCGFQFRLGYM